MTSQRTLFLMAVLLALVLVAAARAAWEPLQLLYLRARYEMGYAPPVSRRGTIEALRVKRTDDGDWYAEIDYEYSGMQEAGHLVGQLLVEPGSRSADALQPRVFAVRPALPGRRTARIDIERPPAEMAPLRTSGVRVELRNGGTIAASQDVAQVIEWPSFEAWAQERELARRTSQENFRRAVELIDRGDGQALGDAKRLLERLIVKDPKFDAGFVELARVVMKANWGPEGLHQAENLLNSALQIRPGSVNAKILLGYVYAHQKRYEQAEALFAQSAQTDTKNLWLWANWGEVLAMQGRIEPAIARYREAVTRPRTHDTYDRARLDAYEHLLVLLEQREDRTAMEALHRQRAEEFGPGSCFSAEYARFVLGQRGDAAEAIVLARQAVDGQCGTSEGREALGLGYYVAWATATGPQRDESLHQARVFFPAGPGLLYQLAASERTVAAARQLKLTGEAIDQLDNRGFNALAYALERNDWPAARRLLKLGARTDTPVGNEKIPVALLPVITSNVDGVRVMQQFGVDYSKLRFRGMTAIDHAKRVGDRRLLEALDRQASNS